MSDASRQALGIRRAYDCLSALGRSGGHLTYSQIQRSLDGLADPTLARLLRGLRGAGLIEAAESGYQLTEHARRQARLITGQADLGGLVQPFLDRLTTECLATSACFVPDGPGLVLVAKRERDDGCHLMPVGGRRDQLEGHACALVLCAFNPICAQLMGRQLRRDLGLAGEAWRNRLAEVRQAGFHAGLGEERWAGPSFSRIAAPILLQGEAVAALCIAGHHLARPERCSSLVRAAAAEAGRSLDSWRPGGPGLSVPAPR